MTKTEMKKTFKEMIQTYKIKEEAGYDVEIESRYFIDNIFGEIFAEVVIKRDDEILDDLTLEFDFDGSMGKTCNFAKEVEWFFKDLNMNATYRKVIAN